jgi:hypothetical protein
VDNRVGFGPIKSVGFPAHALKSRAVVGWHAALCAIAVLNLVLWCLAASTVTHGTGAGIAQLLLCGGYVLGCAYRSVLPVYDIPRVVLVDSRLSSVMVGRSVATAAELCFAAQWALLLHRMALLSASPNLALVSLAILPLIVLAEACSWYAVLTTAQRAHALENSLWGLAAALVVAILLLMEPQRVPGLHLPMMAWCVGGAAYVAYIFLFDVPEYWSRWRADQTNGRQYLGLAQGLIDASRIRIVSHNWETWKSEIIWMSLYFTVGVWCSISLVYASLSLIQPLLSR